MGIRAFDNHSTSVAQDSRGVRDHPGAGVNISCSLLPVVRSVAQLFPCVRGRALNVPELDSSGLLQGWVTPDLAC